MNTDLTPRTDRSTVGGGLFASAIERQTRRDLERVVGNARVAMVLEDARGQLTNESMEIIGTLSAMEAQLIQVAPLGEARYKVLVDACTMGAANSIARLH